MAVDISFNPVATGTLSVDGRRIASIDPRLSRSNYFDGQLLRASDLTRDQIYLDERLLELGQVLGSGIARGLDLQLVDEHILRLSPGLALAPSGRVLELAGRVLEVNLQDSALIATLNQGRERRLARGLYAVVLTRAEVVDGIAEAYPADLAAPRVPRVSAWAEGVELGLAPLALPLPRGDALAVRAGLAREFLLGGEQPALPSDEAVALALMAVDRGRVLWLDQGLLRRPLRPWGLPGAMQRDLAAHYRELLADVLAARRAGGLNGAFPARQHFRVLPPFGPLPREAVDPVEGRQLFLPEGWEVSIAPVRRADLPAILDESATLSPMDLERDPDADVMVLVPMGDTAFAQRARQLEAPAETAVGKTGRLARLDGLALRLFARPAVHRLETDADVWKAIMAETAQEEILFVRRPPRAAETNVSALVLALGAELPKKVVALPPDADKLEQELDAAIDKAEAAQAAADKAGAAAKKLKAKVEELEKKLDLGSDARLKEALDQAAKLAAELDAAKKRVAELEAGAKTTEILGTALEAMNDKVKALTAELDAARKRIKDLQNAPVGPDPATDKKLAEFASALDEARKDAAAKKAEADGLAAKLGQANLVLKQRDTDIGGLKQNLDQAKAAAEAAAADAAAKKAEAEKLAAEKAAAAKALDVTGADLAKARDAEAQARKDATQATLDLAAALKAAQDQKAADAAAKKAAEDKAAGLGLEIDAVKKTLQTRETELGLSKAAEATAKTERAQLAVDLAAVAKERDTRAGEAAAAKALADARAAEVLAAKAAATQAATDLAAARQTAKNLEAQLAAKPDLRTILKLADLAAMRGMDPVAAAKLDTAIGANDEARIAAVQILLMGDKSQDALMVNTLGQVAKQPAQLPKLRDALAGAVKASKPIGGVLSARGTEFGLSATEAAKWKPI